MAKQQFKKVNKKTPVSNLVEEDVNNVSNSHQDSPASQNDKSGLINKSYSGQISLTEKQPEKDQNTKDEKAGDVEDKEDSSSISRLIKKFTEKASIPGLNQVNDKESSYAKFLWPCLILAGIVIMTVHLYILITEFLDVPVTTTLSFEYENPNLPSVTICNGNAIMKSKLNQTDVNFRSLVNALDPAHFEKLSGSPKKRRKRFANALKRFNIDKYDDTFGTFSNEHDNEGTSDEVSKIQYIVRSLYMDENRDTRIAIGHDIADMLLWCAFSGMKCFSSDFKLHTSPSNGNCYTIESDKFIVKKVGQDGGLSLLLYLDTDEYVPGLTDGYGARVQIHSPQQLPSVYDTGFFVDTGTETSISLRQITYDRAGALVGKCIDSLQMEVLKASGNQYYATTCQHICLAKEVLKKCSCYDKRDEDVLISSKIENVFSRCRNKNEIECMSNVRTAYFQQEVSCTCPGLCEHHEYSKTIASRKWPTKQYAIFLREAVCEKHPSKCETISKMPMEELRQNFVKLNIYFEDLNTFMIEEEAEYEIGDFASSIGGAISLWVGLSLLTLLEVCNLGFQICVFSCKRKKSKPLPPRPPPPQSIRPQRSTYVGPL